jgi:hypothetical protein
MLEKLEWQSRMYNPESLATLGIQDTGKSVFLGLYLYDRRVTKALVAVTAW